MDARGLWTLGDGGALVVVGSGGRAGRGMRRLTAATLPAAETAPRARVDWRTALRSILEEVYEVLREEGSNCSSVQLGRGEIGAVVLPLQESRWRFSGEDSDRTESREESVRLRAA